VAGSVSVRPEALRNSEVSPALRNCVIAAVEMSLRVCSASVLEACHSGFCMYSRCPLDNV